MSAGPLTVDAGTNGGIRIEGWDRNEIHVQAVINTHARSEADAKQLASGVQIQAGSGKVTATGPSTERREGWSVSFRINVPRHNDLDLNANNGGVSISGVSGNIRFDTNNGGVRLIDIGGDVKGATHNGGLNVLLGGTHWDGRRSRRGNDQRRRHAGDSRRLQRRPDHADRQRRLPHRASDHHPGRAHVAAGRLDDPRFGWRAGARPHDQRRAENQSTVAAAPSV